VSEFKEIEFLSDKEINEIYCSDNSSFCITVNNNVFSWGKNDKKSTWI